MRKIGIYMISVLIITIMVPTVIVKTFNFVPRENIVLGEAFEDKTTKTSRDKKDILIGEDSSDREYTEEIIKVYDEYTDTVLTMDIEEYVKGVVAAEMPAEFHIEALKAQAITARTYAVSRSIRFPDGHPDHPNAPLCTGTHCQAYLSLDKLKERHGEEWVPKYWSKIEEAVNATRGILIYYNGEIVEPLYHSTSGGMTEDAVNVFAAESPYLKSVESPFEEAAPKYKTITTLTGDEFINKINSKYANAKLTKDNFHDKIKLIEKTDSGRIKKIAIGENILDGRDIRDLFSLNSTNFSITYDKKLNIIDIVTYGYGHGVGMSQWGANGMAKNGNDCMDILNHYYTGVEIR